MLYDLSELAKSKECTEKALATAKDIGNREIEVSCYGNLGTVSQTLAVNMQSYKKTEATSSLSLGILLKSLGDYSKSEKHLEKALRMTKKNGCQE